MYYNKSYLGKTSYSIVSDIGKYACGPGQAGPGRAGPKLAAGRAGPQNGLEIAGRARAHL